MGKPRVLLVDNTRLVELEKSFLTISPVNFLTAESGSQALEMVRKEPPDLIVMDLKITAMDGIACCTILKSDPALSAIPVIMITEAERMGERERALRAGCDDFLTKPVDSALFLEKVQQYTANVSRQDVRAACRIPLLLLLDKHPVAATAVDIGEGGIFIATEEPAHLDMPLKFAFYLPTAIPTLFEAGGRVVWLNSREKRLKPELPEGFGVEFRGLDDREYAALKLYLDVELNRKG